MTKNENGRIGEPIIEAREAERGSSAGNVLIVSMGMVMTAFAAIFFVAFAM
jgi:hypothetical protein